MLVLVLVLMGVECNGMLAFRLIGGSYFSLVSSIQHNSKLHVSFVSIALWFVTPFQIQRTVIIHSKWEPTRAPMPPEIGITKTKSIIPSDSIVG
jgi:hypothetical protein